MIWLFALGIIWFCLIHEGFRKVVFWIGGLSLGLGAMFTLAAISGAIH